MLEKEVIILLKSFEQSDLLNNMCPFMYKL